MWQMEKKKTFNIDQKVIVIGSSIRQNGRGKGFQLHLLEIFADLTAVRKRLT